MAFVRVNDTPFNTVERIASGANLSRLVHHMMNGPYGILSGHQGVEDNDQHRALNNERTKALKHRIKEMGHGFIDVGGAWKYDSPDPSLSKYIPEKSLFLPGVDPKVVRQLAKEFQQEAYLSGQQGDFAVKNTENDEPYIGGKIQDYMHLVNEGDDPYAYSTIKGKQMTFREPPQAENPAFSPQNYNEYSEILDNSRNERGAAVTTPLVGLYLYKFAGKPAPTFPQAGSRLLGKWAPFDPATLDIFVPCFLEKSNTR